MATKAAAKTAPVKETKSLVELGHKVLLAYVGMFGVAGDKLGDWFELFVERGEVIEKDARKLVKREEKQVRKFAADVQKQEQAAVHKAEKTVKQTIKQVEAMA